MHHRIVRAARLAIPVYRQLSVPNISSRLCVARLLSSKPAGSDADATRPPPPPPPEVAGVPSSAAVDASASHAGIPPPPPPPPSDGTADAAGAAGAAGTTEGTKKKSSPFDYLGVLAFLSGAGFLTYYIMRQKGAAERRVTLSDSLEDAAAICPGEMKELREANNIR